MLVQHSLGIVSGVVIAIIKIPGLRGIVPTQILRPPHPHKTLPHTLPSHVVRLHTALTTIVSVPSSRRTKVLITPLAQPDHQQQIQ